MKKILLIIGILVILMTSTGCMRIVNDGEVGVKKTLGNYNDLELGTGLKFFVPFISWIEIVNTKLITVEEAVQVPSEEGLIVTLDVSVRVPNS